MCIRDSSISTGFISPISFHAIPWFWSVPLLGFSEVFVPIAIPTELRCHGSTVLVLPVDDVDVISNHPILLLSVLQIAVPRQINYLDLLIVQ